MADTTTAVRPEDTTSVGSRISWGAVLAGVVVALAVYLVLTTLAAAIGFTIPTRNISEKALLNGALVWAIVSLALAMFAGGWTVSQLTAGETQCESMIHGLILWGTVVAVMLWMTASGIGTGFSAMMRTSYGAGEAAEGEPAWAQVAGRVGVPEEKIAQMRAGLEDPNSDQAKTARKNASLVSWGTLLGVLLSMGAAIAGAYAGSGPSPFGLWAGRGTLRRTTGTTATGERQLASHI